MKTNIKINFEQISTNLEENLNILVISDIHIDKFQDNIEYLNKLLSIISYLNIDYILIPGDLIQTYKVLLSNVNTLIKEFGKIAPTIISIGNHELQAVKNGLNLKWFIDLENFNNVYPLINSGILLNDIQFSGFSPNLDVYFPKTKNKNELFLQEFMNSGIKINSNAEFKIMLSHNPNYINKQTLQNNEVLNNFNLFISKGFRKFPQENIFMNKLDSLYSNDIHHLVLKKKK